MQRKSTRCFLWVAAILSFAAATCFAQQPGQRAPVPSDAAQAKARELIREAFQREYATAKTPEAQVTLAKEMIEQASKTQNEPAAHFALLRIAADIAQQAGDARLAVEAVNAIVRTYDVDALSMKADCLQSVARGAKGPSQQQNLAKEAMGILDTAIDADDYTIGGKLLDIALDAARKGRDYPLVKQIVDRKREIQSLEEAYDRYRQALATLEQKATDPEANLAAGRYLCVAKNNWDKGIPMLALGSDPQLKAQAASDLRARTSADERVAVGDGWWELAQAAAGRERDSFLLRAGSWYQAAQPDVASGLVKVKLTKRLDTIVKVGRPVPRLADRAAPAPAEGGPVEAVFRNVLRGHEADVWSVAFTPDGKLLASTGYDATIRFWDVTSGRPLRQLRTPPAEPQGKWPLALSPDGKTVAFSSGQSTVKLWDLASGEQKVVLQRHTAPVYTLAFSPDGKLLASSGQQQTVYLWDTGSSQVSQTLPGRCPWSWTVRFSPDGKRLASTGCDGAVKIWDLARPQEPKVLGSHESKGRCVAFSPDGRHLASAGDDTKIMVWNLATGEKTATLARHTKLIWALAYSPDGNLLASGSQDGTVRLWDPKTGDERAKLDAQNDPNKPAVLDLAFSPDGKTLVSANQDGTLKVWKLVAKQAAP